MKTEAGNSRAIDNKFFYVFVAILPVLFLCVVIIGYSSYIILGDKKTIDLRMEGDWPIQSDELIGFVAAKNSAAIRSHIKKDLRYHVYTDSIGARVNASTQQTPNRVDIATIGGSFSWGHGMENEETFTEILGNEFNVPVVNLALGSYGTVQSVQMLERNAYLKPKLVIYGFITEHIRRNLSPCAPSYAPFCLPVSYVDFEDNGHPYIRRPRVKYSQELGQKFFKQVAIKTFSFRDILWGTKAVLSNWEKKFKFGYRNDNESRKKSMDFLIKKMIALAESIDAVVVVVHIPYLGRNQTNSAPPELTEFLREDVEFIDLSTVVARYYSEPNNSLLRFKNDGHPNPTAHKLIAREIKRGISPYFNLRQYDRKQTQ